MQVQMPMMRKEFITGTIDCESADMICNPHKLMSFVQNTEKEKRKGTTSETEGERLTEGARGIG
jgi:hypothetical protein